MIRQMDHGERPQGQPWERGSDGHALCPDTATELARLELAALRNQAAMGQSLGRLDRIVRSAGKDTRVATLSASGAAVVYVLAAYGLDPSDRSADLSRLTEDHGVSETARILGARTRRLVLPADWWRQDHGHFVAYAKTPDAQVSDGIDSETVPVALISRSSGGYMMHRPGDAKATLVTENLAANILPTAIEILPPLQEKVQGFRDFARFLLPMVKSDLAWVVVAGAVTGLIGAAFPVATGIVIDSLIPGHERQLLIQLGLALALAALLSYGFSVTRQLMLLRIDGRTGFTLDAAIWDRMLKLPAGFYKAHSSGDLSSRIGGVGTLRGAVISVVLSAVITTAFSLFYLVLLFIYDGRLALIAVGLVVVLVAITLAIGLIQMKYHRRQSEVSGWLSGYVFQVLQAIVKLRIAGAEDRAFVRWADKFADERAAILATRRISNHFGAFADVYATLSLTAIFGCTFYLSTTPLTTGTFIAFLAAFGGFQSAFQGLSGAALTVVGALPYWERAKPLLAAEPESRWGAADPGKLTGALEVTNVTFAYGDGPPVLTDISMEVEPGEQVAIVGPSGSGKSTLIRILLGLERPQHGTVLFDGQDLDGLDLTLVRRQIGVVTQNGKIAAGSIIDNIRGATISSHEDCLEACISAGLEEDLKQFPMGLHTPLTEGASTLSGGQRQRILIARALVNRPRILIFDEATSALDNRTQSIVTESLNRLNVTRLVVAHRLSTIQDADKIFVIDKGQIAESGDYNALMASGGLFADLAQRQIV